MSILEFDEISVLQEEINDTLEYDTGLMPDILRQDLIWSDPREIVELSENTLSLFETEPEWKKWHSGEDDLDFESDNDDLDSDYLSEED